MKLKSIFLAAALLAGCGTTSTKFVHLPALPKDAPVEVFYSTPNLKYEKICDIEATGNNSLGGGYTQKEDFASMFKEEARKCGADGVIFNYLSGFQSGTVKAYATGIKITGKGAGLVDAEKIKAFSLAIQSHDLKKVSEIIAPVPKQQKERAPSDDALINQGLYIATLDGLSCDPKIVQLLEKEYEGRVTQFGAVNIWVSGRSDSETPFCQNVMARSLSKMVPLSDAIVKVNNHYVSLIMDAEDDLPKKAAAFRELLITAAKLIAGACQKDSTDPVCATKGAFLDLSNKTKNALIKSVKSNATQVLAILK